MVRVKQIIGFGLSVLCVIACQKKEKADQVNRRTTFFDKTGMDTTVSPGNDFFTYANGGWVRKTAIPGDQTGWGSFYQIYEDNQIKTRTILDEAAGSKAKAGSVEQQVGDFYASGMDTLTIEKLGYEPLKAELARIAALTDYKGVLNYIASDKANRGGEFIGLYVGADDRQSSLNRINFGQAGLSLPEKDYYTKTDSSTRKIRAAFVAYVAKLFTMVGVDAATARTKADAILEFETALAASHKAPADLRDPVANYNKLAVADLTKRMPNLDWRTLLTAMSLGKIDTVLVSQPGYYQALDKLLPATPISVLKDRLVFDLLDNNASLLSKPFERASFEFNSKTLYGQPQQKERWKRIASRVDGSLGEALGQLWVKKYFPAEAKERMLTLVDNLQKVYRERIEKLDWMAPETKKVALIKLDKFAKKIGYPDKWKDYSDIDIKRDDYFGNVQRAREHYYNEEFAKINEAVDKAEWGMTPPTVNAYANPTNNEIVFPAGILQFPFFDKDADDAINYGGIGMVIGHEMTHLFDDQGRQYDAQGNLRDWWTKQDAERFSAKTQAVVNQYNGYTVLDNLHLNGRLTLGENLADLGGITLAYQAFKLTKQGQGTEKIDGFTPDQRFFLGFAQVWRIKVRDETERVGVATDPHSPAKFRVNGPLTNFAPFYQAFSVKAGQKLFKPEVEQARVW
ncbi:M13 family metallopeptidase [Spirosoma utsteinense]|uniref:Endopeptidase n=1 Tax=Spirosoma utsteinense TaxID=2585773 RepID=A0ABR6W723_9BACT|nr:M13 family metallopeptidase [Spirosoma utsteinense]MBC3785592.1 putative endopeptidase [Spirosoma utsteinense]MBC3791742.1 putative endopeptidase [Spirosoma utsteinense]